MVFEFLKAYILGRRSGALVRTIGWISIVGIILSVSALVVVISVMQGFGAGIRDRLLSVEPHIVIELDPAVRSRSEAEFKAQEIEKILPKSQAHVFENQDLIVRTVDGLYSGAIGSGIESGTLKEILTGLDKAKRKNRPGALPLDAIKYENETYQLSKGEVVIGSDLANAIQAFEGDELTMISPEALLLPPGEMPRMEQVRVKAILRSNVPQIDSMAVFYGLDETLRTLRYSKPPPQKIEVRLTDPSQIDEPSDLLKSKGYKLQTWRDRNSALFYSLKVEKLLMTLFLFLTFVIGSFSIVTLLALLSTQKRLDIGMLQAMGLYRSRIRTLFSGIGIWITVIGMTCGLLFGLFFCWWLEKTNLITLPVIYYDTNLPVEIDFKTIGIVLSSVFVLSVVISLLATRKTLKLSPVQALRWKH